ncbi:MAG: PKD domain-containing protein, partial [Deinococcales bacterium]|nr:PKD domain-containing protein [Chitinophagaceae bacterium]
PVIPIFCGAYFKFSAQGTSVKFSSSSNLLAPNDTVIGYKWDFGDNTSNLTSKDPLYVYVKAGTYVVCLTIKTARGCESKICETITLRDSVPPVVVLPPLINCVVNFAFIPQLSGVKFNSNMTIVAPHDTIVSRKWDFGDGETKINTIDPVHIYTKLGKYNVCFSIKTAKGCESRICKTVVLGDSLSTVIGSIVEPIKIIKVYPNPVHDKLNILAWSLNKDVASEISVIDVYGQKKFSKKVMLTQGNNSVDINTSLLSNGPYFLKITTVFGVVSIRFYKF